MPSDGRCKHLHLHGAHYRSRILTRERSERRTLFFGFTFLFSRLLSFRKKKVTKENLFGASRDIFV